MPIIYALHSDQVLQNYTTNGTPNTENDTAFIKPGASRAVLLFALRVQGKGGGLTALTGLGFRIKQWTSTASSGGSSMTASPKDNRLPAAVETAAAATTASGTVTSGTGGPSIVGGCGCGASGPGGWVAANPDDQVVLDGNANKSIDLFSSSPTASMNYEFENDTME